MTSMEVDSKYTYVRTYFRTPGVGLSVKRMENFAVTTWQATADSRPRGQRSPCAAYTAVFATVTLS